LLEHISLKKWLISVSASHISSFHTICIPPY
jgi:hypothetical protein